MKIKQTKKRKPLVTEQLPLLPEVHDPLALPVAPNAEKTKMSYMRTKLLGCTLSMLIVLSSVLYLRTQPIIPEVPIPTLQFGYSGPWSSMLSADVLSVVKDGRSAFVEYLEPEEGERVSVRAGEHTLIRVPYSIVKNIQVSQLFHPMHVKTRSFSVYKYEGDEPPFHEQFAWRSRVLSQRLGSGRNFTVRGGDLIYIMLEEEGEVTDLLVSF